MSWSPQASTGTAKTRSGDNRVCFTLRFDTSDLGSYLKDHEAVWPEMQQALVDCGWRNYSLFYRAADGFAVGYFETDADFATACARMEAHPVNARWQTAMARYTPSNMGSPLDDGDTSLRHYFYLGEDAPGGTPAPEAAAVAAAGPSRAMLAATLGVGVGCGLLLSRLFKDK